MNTTEKRRYVSKVDLEEDFGHNQRNKIPKGTIFTHAYTSPKGEMFTDGDLDKADFFYNEKHLLNTQIFAQIPEFNEWDELYKWYIELGFGFYYKHRVGFVGMRKLEIFFDFIPTYHLRCEPDMGGELGYIRLIGDKRCILLPYCYYSLYPFTETNNKIDISTTEKLANFLNKMPEWLSSKKDMDEATFFKTI